MDAKKKILNFDDLEKVSGGKYEITDDCIGCGFCVDECPEQCIYMLGERAYIITERCTGCGVCAAGCPVDYPTNPGIRFI